MYIKNTIVVVAAVLAIFTSIAALGGILQKIQDARSSAIIPGFVPSTGQINNGTWLPLKN